MTRALAGAGVAAALLLSACGGPGAACPEGTQSAMLCVQCAPGGGCAKTETRCAKVCTATADCGGGTMDCAGGLCRLGACP